MVMGYWLLVIEVNVYWLVFMDYWLEGIEGIELRVYWLWVIEGLGGGAWGGAFDKNAAAGDYFGFFV